ncbi:hypothetical protein EDD15DRAFT_2195216 [Pisolithus albus]|nr:hypothetical protein EDD15DRAFT_2195216 [Pisolithus albus]
MAGKPLEREHMEVLNGWDGLKMPDEVEDVGRKAKLASKPAGHASGVDMSNKMAHEDLPLCDGSMINGLPSSPRLMPLEEEQALHMSSSPMNLNDKLPRLIKIKSYRYGGSTAHGQEEENGKGIPNTLAGHADELNGYMKWDIPDA